MRGVQRLADAGGDLERMASVASFFVSRVDTEADKRLDEVGGHDELKGTLAIANAKLAYETYKEIFAGEQWEALRAKGASAQRCLWASTSTKNPDYRDVIYVEELIGPRHRQHDAARDRRGVPGPRRGARLARGGRRRRAPHARGVRGRPGSTTTTSSRRSSARASRSSPSRSSSCSPTSRPSATRWWRHERAAAMSELGQQLRVDSVRCSAAAGSGHPTSSMSAADLMAVLLDGGYLRMDTERPRQPGQRPPDLLQGPRVAALLRGAQGGGHHRRRRAADVPQARLAPGGPPDAAHPADRRRDRIARPGSADRGRRRARGRASSTACRTASGACAATPRWPRARSGRRSSTPPSTASTT